MKSLKFNYKGNEITIKCKGEDKMKKICEEYAIKINIDIDILIFLYNGKELNLNLKYNEIINQIDTQRNEMNVLVYIDDNKIIKCKKCGEIIKLDNKIINNILNSNKNKIEAIIGLKEMINNIINNYNVF